MDTETKFSMMRDHFMHRKYAIDAQLAAYKTWHEYTAKPPHERTPGEEHFCMCMEEWEKRYQPFRPHPDFDCDAGIQLFDHDMAFHDQAAQALMSLEEQRRLRAERLRKKFKSSDSNAVQAGTSTCVTPQPPQITGQKRGVPDDAPGNDMFDAPAPIAQPMAQRPCLDAPEKKASKILSNASL